MFDFPSFDETRKVLQGGGSWLMQDYDAGKARHELSFPWELHTAFISSFEFFDLGVSWLFSEANAHDIEERLNVKRPWR